MASKKKFVMPTLDLEGAPSEVVQLAALLSVLTDQTNAAHEKIVFLEAEVARLKKARERGARSPK